MKKYILVLMVICLAKARAGDTTVVGKGIMTLNAYLETYYCYDMGNPSDHVRPSFFYSYNRHNEINLNLAYLKAAYVSDDVRGNLALMSGTYAQYNLAGEPGVFRNIFEANAGFKLAKKRNLWVDAGIMPSHIGFESAIGKDCWNLTRSMLADNSPYYECGVKFSYTSKNEKLYGAFMYLNGWQRIQRIPHNQTPAFGTQLTFKPNTNAVFNWSTYIGNEQPDSAMKWRYFSNLYAQFDINKKWAMTAGLDIGMQQSRDTSLVLNGWSQWYAPVVIFRYAPNKKRKFAARVEYYGDKDGVMIATGTQNGFQTLGYSLNMDYAIRENILWRIEGRALMSKDKIFMLNNKPASENYFITTALALTF